MTRNTGKALAAAIVKKLDEKDWPNDGVDHAGAHHLPVLPDLELQPPKPPQPKRRRRPKVKSASDRAFDKWTDEGRSPEGTVLEGVRYVFTKEVSGRFSVNCEPEGLSASAGK